MGIPKFYRWLSERYPCLSEVVKEYQIPEFDNLYLDMNGIIHTCSHPDDTNVLIQISEKKVFDDICHYIEVLFRMIKPKKVFYMAVDGVAPRAKMNQQRGRRFRSAKEAELMINKAVKKGEIVTPGARFDSNCITPGTEFMTRLHAALKDFVEAKVDSDPLWQQPYIIFSGHETPGEGEHKIMDFIRHEKSKPTYDPNTRHCLYGLDADLIMLSLVSHEPHFALLREEIKFTKKDALKRSVLPEDTTFHLLHISLLRDYLDLEFHSLKDLLPFGYDTEKIIDDWVLMGFLVGNDFIPHLPNLHIHQDCLPVLWNAYKKILPTLEGYLNEKGFLNLPRLEKFLTSLHWFDFEIFEERIGDEKWLKGKKNSNKNSKLRRNGHQKSRLEIVVPHNLLDGEDEEDEEQDGEMEDEIEIPEDVPVYLNNSLSSELAGIPTATYAEKNGDDMVVTTTSDSSTSIVSTTQTTTSDSKSDEYQSKEFVEFKEKYYIDKFKYSSVDDDILRSLAYEYVLALQWILHYYYNGIQSWSWYYPFHYAPFLSDIRGFSKFEIRFDMGKPFLPFQQLMAVLPRASKELLPLAYQSLMENGSALEDYYPVIFETDLNGKLQEWEAVVLIPFIDEKVLLDGMDPLTEKMTPEESGRNKHGPHHVYCCIEKDIMNSFNVSKTSVDQKNRAVHCELPPKYFVRNIEELYKGLCNGVLLKSLIYGFPTLQHLPHAGSLQNSGVRVFQRSSSNPSMILSLTANESLDLSNLSKSLIGRMVYVNWPHLIEALVVYVSTDEEKFVSSKELYGVASPVDISIETLTNEGQAQWHKQVETIKDTCMSRYGINIGTTKILIGAKRIIGKKYVIKSSGEVVLEKQWSRKPEAFLYQTCVCCKESDEQKKENCQSLSEFFPRGAQVFMLGNPYYGCEGKVTDVSTKDRPRITAEFKIPVEPNLRYLKDSSKDNENSFMPAYVIGQRLGVSAHLISRITGTVFLQDEETLQKLNVGLQLKYSKQNMEVPGYTKKTPKEWLYSRKVLNILGEYMEKFSELFGGIATMSTKDIFSANVIFDENRKKKMAELELYLKSLPCHGLEGRAFGTILLDEEVVGEIEKEVEQANAQRGLLTNLMKVKPHLLFQPKIIHSPCAPDQSATFELFDRVVNVRSGYSVPLGLRGTIIGISPGEKSIQDSLYDVLFDVEFPGGMTLRCSSRKCYRVPAVSLVNISHGERLWAYGPKGKFLANRNLQQALTPVVQSMNKSNNCNALDVTYNQKPTTSVMQQETVKQYNLPIENDKKESTTEKPSNSEYSRIWSQLERANNKPVVAPPKPPQEWIEKSPSIHKQTTRFNPKDYVQLSFDELMKNSGSLETPLKQMSLSNQIHAVDNQVQHKQPPLTNQGEHKQPPLSNQIQQKQSSVANQVQHKQPPVANQGQYKQPQVTNQVEHKQLPVDNQVHHKQSSVAKAQHKHHLLGNQVQHKQPLLGNQAQHKQPLLGNQVQHKQPSLGNQAQHRQQPVVNQSQQKQPLRIQLEYQHPHSLQPVPQQLMLMNSTNHRQINPVEQYTLMNHMQQHHTANNALRGYVSNDVGNEPTQPASVENKKVKQLNDYMSARGLPPPTYQLDHIPRERGYQYQAKVMIPGGSYFLGSMARSQELACESAAAVALFSLAGHVEVNANRYNFASQMPPPLQNESAASAAQISPLLNPNASAFVPTQVLLQQKSTRKISDQPRTQNRLKEKNNNKQERNINEPNETENNTKTIHHNKKVNKPLEQTSRRNKKRIAATFKNLS